MQRTSQDFKGMMLLGTGVLFCARMVYFLEHVYVVTHQRETKEYV